ncbi:hypothetical protein KCP69_04630 [Salmonella enterica subsp. enterica]|nr:hypothetical protein KCP69_04630 [Salmonella enterica subsp. enterica]
MGRPDSRRDNPNVVVVVAGSSMNRDGVCAAALVFANADGWSARMARAYPTVLGEKSKPPIFRNCVAGDADYRASPGRLTPAKVAGI